MLSVKELYIALSSFSRFEGPLHASSNPTDAHNIGNRLTSLSLSLGDAASMQPLVHVLSTSNVKLENFAAHDENYYASDSQTSKAATVMNIIYSQKATLTTLEFPQSGCFDIDISMAPNIRNLLFEFRLGPFNGFNNMVKVLSTVRSGNIVRKVNFEMYLDVNPYDAISTPHYMHGWNSLDIVLSGSQFEKLETVHVLVGKWDGIVNPERFKMEFANLLPRLQEKGKLCIDFTTAEFR